MEPTLPYLSNRTAPVAIASETASRADPGIPVSTAAVGLRLPYLHRYSLRTQTRMLLGVSLSDSVRPPSPAMPSTP